MTSGCDWIAAGGPSAMTRPLFSTMTVSEIAHHQAHVVLDQEHGHVLLAYAPDQLDQALPLGAGHARGRLVQQQEPGACGQRHRQLHEPLLAVR